MEWYKKNWLCVVLLFLFFPAGAYLLWKYHSNWNKNIKMGITIVMALFFVLITSSCFAKIDPEELSLDGQTFTLDLNETKDINVIVSPEDADVSAVEFISDDNEIAAFEKAQNEEQLYGTVTAISEGKTFVYVRFKDIESEKIEIVVEDKARIEAERKENAIEVDDLISDIGEVSLNSKRAIALARSYYDKLENESKKYVTKYSVLTAAEDKYEEIYDAASQKAQEVTDAINDIGNVTLYSENAINEARSAYDALDDDVKTLVKNYSILTNAESKLGELKEAEAERKAQEELERQQATQNNSISGGNTISGNSGSSSYYGTVYWTPNGEKYHTTRHCRTLSRSKTIYSGSIAEAQANGKYEECKVCG